MNDPGRNGKESMTNPDSVRHTRAMTDVRRVETLSRRESLDLLTSAHVGRVSFVDTGTPTILPISFTVDDDSIVMRTAQGSRLSRAASQGAVMAFQVDDLEPASRQGWSVLVTGEAAIDSDESEHLRLDRRLTAWVPGFKDVWVRLAMARVTGRRLVERPDVITLPSATADSWRSQAGWVPRTRTRADSTNEFDGR